MNFAIHELKISGEEKEKVMSKKKKGIAVVLGIVIIVVLALAVVLRVVGKKAGKSQESGVTLHTTPLQKMDLTSSVSVTGTIASKDSRTVTSGLSDVEVTSVSVAVGDYVKAGDVICTFDSATIEDELEEAKAEYSLQSQKGSKTVSDAKDSISEAESAYTDGISSGNDSIAQAKEAYDKAVSLRDQAKSAYEKATDAEETAQKQYEKVKENKSALKKNMETAQKAYEEAKANYEKASEVTDVDLTSDIYDAYKNAEAAYEKAKNEYDQVEQCKQNYENAKTKKTEAKEAYAAAETEVSSAYAKYEKAQSDASKQNEKNADAIEDKKEEYSITATETANNLENQQNKVTQVEDKLDDCVVTSPIDGVVTSVLIEIGDTYKGEEIAVIQDMENFVVDATVDEYDISNVAKGMKAVIKTDATDDEELEGEVTFVAPTPNSVQGNAGDTSNTSNYSIQITLKDKDDRLRVGMTAKTSIVLDSATDVFAVAYDCIETDDAGNSYITVVNYDETLAATVPTAAGESQTETMEHMYQGAEGEKPEGTGAEMPERPEGGMPGGAKPSTVSENETDRGEKKGRWQTETDGQSTLQQENQTEAASSTVKGESVQEGGNTRRIPVTVGMESDYYVEISGEGLYEGMSVVTTVNKSSSTDSPANEKNNMMFPMTGSGTNPKRGGGSYGGPGGF